MKRIVFSLVIVFSCLLSLSASTEITLKSSSPLEGSKVSTLSQLYFEFDFTDFCAANDLNVEEVGLKAATNRVKKNIKLYKGDASSGTLLETCYGGQTWEAGKYYAAFSLSKTYSLEDGTLEDGQKYTIVISENVFYAAKSSSENYDTHFSATTITFYGGVDENSLTFNGSYPENNSEVAQLGIVKFEFNSDIEISNESLKAGLYEELSSVDKQLLKEVAFSVSENDKKIVEADFGNESLKATKKYHVVLPSGSVKMSNGGTSFEQVIELIYNGGTYNLFGFKSITPDSGTVCSNVGKVTVVPEWPDGAAGFVNYSSIYYGDDGPWVFPVNLYQGIDSTGVLVETYKTSLNGACTALQVNVTKQLEANTKYALVFPEGLIPAWKDQGTGTYPPLEGYHSAPLTLVYTGANTPLDGKWSVTENDQLSKLGIVSFMTGGTATANEGAKMELYNGEDSIASATLNASGTLCYADFGGLALEKDGDYSLVIPDSAIVNMPKTTQKFKGIAKPAEYATLSYKAGNTTIVADSVLVGSKVAFNVEASDTLDLDSLTLNGAAVALTDSAYVIDSIAANADLAAAIRYIPTPAEYIDVTYKSAGTTLETKNVLKGTQLTFNVAECDTLKLDSLVLNGLNVTDSIKSGAFTTDSLTENTVIEASMQYIPTPAPETKFYAVEYAVKSVVGDEENTLTSSSTMVAEDSVFTFKAPELDENWSIEVSAGEMSEDSTYSIAVASDTSIVVTCSFIGEVSYVDETTTGIFDVNGNEVKISTTEGKIVVEGAQVGDVISLYGLNSAKLGQWTVKQDKQTIDVNSGVYIVVVKGDGGKAAAKVSVK